MIATLFVHDHIVHFYHLHAWMGGYRGRPQGGSKALGNWPEDLEMAQIVRRILHGRQNRLKGFVGSGQLGIFANAYWGHPAYKLPPEANLLATPTTSRLWAGRRKSSRSTPSSEAKNPHPNCWWRHALLGQSERPGAINIDTLTWSNPRSMRPRTSSSNCTFPTCWPSPRSTRTGPNGAAASATGRHGLRRVPDRLERSVHPPLEGRALLDGNLNEVLEVDVRDPQQIQEFVSHSWYEYAKGDPVALHPWDGETRPKSTGPNLLRVFGDAAEILVDEGAAVAGHAMEGGPLARTLLALAHKDEEVKSDLDASLKQLDVPSRRFTPRWGETLARGLETRRAGRMLKRCTRNWWRTLRPATSGPPTWSNGIPQPGRAAS